MLIQFLRWMNVFSIAVLMEAMFSDDGFILLMTVNHAFGSSSLDDVTKAAADTLQGVFLFLR